MAGSGDPGCRTGGQVVSGGALTRAAVGAVILRDAGPARLWADEGT